MQVVLDHLSNVSEDEQLSVVVSISFKLTWAELTELLNEDL